MRKYVSLYAALESTCLGSEPSTAPLRNLVVDCCKEAQLTHADMLLSCSLTGMSFHQALLPSRSAATPAEPAEPGPAPLPSVAEAWNYMDAHGRPLRYVKACAIACGATVTTGHNPVPENA